MIILTFSFFLIAFLYSMIGFGGGSSYLAILALTDRPFYVIPQIALLCNIIVVSSGAFHFVGKGHFKAKLFWPFVSSSIPLAFFGGWIPVTEKSFFLLLGLALFFSGIRLLLPNKKRSGEREPAVNKFNWVWGVPIGGILGLFSGMVGIGGGIFLAPLLLNLRWGKPKEVATTAALFILLNSMAGLLGQSIKRGAIIETMSYWPLFLVVFVGGQLGSSLGAGNKISQRWVRIGTGVLVLFVGTRILLRNFGI